MTPTTEACEALARLGIPYPLIIPADLGASARYNGLLLVATWSQRDALADNPWHVHAVAGRASRVATASTALDGLRAVVEDIWEAWEALPYHVPMEQQLADAAHQRRIAEMT